jgi:hypothetical protein
MHYLASIYFVKQTLQVSGMFIAHHQEVFTEYIQQLVRVVRLSCLAGWPNIKMQVQQNIKKICMILSVIAAISLNIINVLIFSLVEVCFLRCELKSTTRTLNIQNA